MDNNIIIILGNDHSNTLGLIQSIGKSGYNVYAAVWGVKTGLCIASKYLKRRNLIGGGNADDCIYKLVEVFKSVNEKIPILCACDGAALAVERHKQVLKEKFVFEHAKGNYSINELQEKSLQVSIARKAGFNVPESFTVNSIKDINKLQNLNFPCIFKALKSVEGDKGDLTVCNTHQELIERATYTLKKTPRILVQQYIDRDYEISILGCALKSGECEIPCIEDKLTLYPKKVGLECLARVKPLEDIEIIQCIRKLINLTGYVGLFSVEMMHSKIDNQFYFTEINFRNDGAQSFIRKYGINLPLIHIKDLLNETYAIDNIENNLSPGYYIWEIHHLFSLLHGDIGFTTWLKEIFRAKSGLVFDLADIKPFICQFSRPITGLIKKRQYY